jgi:uncharacterized protein
LMKKIILQPAADEIEIEPFGIDGERPVMLFREKGGDLTLPVWLAPIDAGIALTQHHVQAVALSPHDITLRVLKTLGVSLESVHFVELQGHHQYVELRFVGSRKIEQLKVRADHAISFCLHAKTRFFCTRDFLAKCRSVRTESTVQVQERKRGSANQYLN